MPSAAIRLPSPPPSRRLKPWLTLLASRPLPPRHPDGSRPNGFARWVNGSELTGQGVEVGIPLKGAAPDDTYEF